MSTYDLQAAVDEAIAEGGGTITLPPGISELARPVYVPDTAPPIEIRGALEGTYGGATGSSLRARASNGFTEDVITMRGKAHTLRNFRLFGVDGDRPPQRGIVVSFSYGRVENVSVDRMGGDGIYSEGAVDNTVQTWGCLFEQCRSALNGGNGFATEGASSGLNTFINCDARANDGAGYYEGAYLTNTYVNCHASSNDRTSWEQTGLASYATLVNCYAELDQPPPMFQSGQFLILGGSIAALAASGESPAMQRVGYSKSRLTFGEDGGNRATICHTSAPIVASHSADKSALWAIAQRYQGSMPWAQDCRVLLRHKADPYMAYMVTDERHSLGPGHPVQGNSHAPSKFRKCLTQHVAGPYCGPVVFQDAIFDPNHNGTPKAFVTISGDGDCRVTRTTMDRSERRFTVYVDACAGTFSVDVLAERWA